MAKITPLPSYAFYKLFTIHNLLKLKIFDRDTTVRDTTVQEKCEVLL